MKSLFFLSGLPRSGSTLLGSILSQHPKLQATPTSPLADLLCWIDEGFSKIDIQYTYDKEQIQYNTYSSLLANFYNHIPKPIIIDKHRGWPSNIQTLQRFIRNPKIIATYRPIPEIITSYITLIEKNQQSDNFIDNHLRSLNLEITNSNRADLLWNEYLSESYSSIVTALNNHKENILLVEYNKLISNPQEELNKIYDFFGIPKHEHDFSNINNTCKEDKDYAWGLNGLHDIRPNLQKVSKDPEEVLGKEVTAFYNQFNL